MQRMLNPLMHNGMPGIMPALIAHHKVIIFSDPINNFSLPLISPLDPHNDICHKILSLKQSRLDGLKAC